MVYSLCGMSNSAVDLRSIREKTVIVACARDLYLHDPCHHMIIILEMYATFEMHETSCENLPSGGWPIQSEEIFCWSFQETKVYNHMLEGVPDIMQFAISNSLDV